MDYFGMTPTDLAKLAGKNKDALLETLNAHGALSREETVFPYQFDAATHQNYFGQTPFHFANLSKQREELKKSEALIVYVNKGDPYLRTPLMYIAIKNSLDGAQFLCSFGADVNAQDYQKRNALFYAVVYASKEIVETMLIAGGDPDMADVDGVTPIAVAELYGRHDLLQMFENHVLKQISEPSYSSFLPSFMKSSIQSIQEIITGISSDKKRQVPSPLVMRKNY